ncbi:hypothetical protein C2845_PMPSC048708 [Panicum miliaceum]|uniref:BHLH domain-containing protein n=1 Tax=Panicum miliaceum TaxID=4540 RepID=A0A3L6P9K1_PANMI|nr:hypothetical protein C2845_PMPSC048708 [Panicum miliaceum]
MAAAVQRKETERRRRQQIKGLCARLASLIPEHHWTSSLGKAMNQFDILDAAVSYIKELKEMVERLEQHRRRSSPAQPSMATTTGGGGGGGAASTSAAAPVVLARLQPPDGSSVDVTLVTGAPRPLTTMLHEVMAVLEEEGAEVLNATLSVVAGRRIFCSVHSRAFSSRIGIDVRE